MADDVLEKYAEAVRSGAYPETHPDVLPKFGEIYPKDPEPSVPTFPPPVQEEKSFWKRNKWYIVGIIITASLSAVLLYVAFKKDPKGYLEDKIEAIETKVAAMQLVPGTDIELEKVQAWERLQMKLIEEFFATNKGPGVKALCISMANQERCIASSASAKKARKLLQQMN